MILIALVFMALDNNPPENYNGFPLFVCAQNIYEVCCGYAAVNQAKPSDLCLIRLCKKKKGPPVWERVTPSIICYPSPRPFKRGYREYWWNFIVEDDWPRKATCSTVPRHGASYSPARSSAPRDTSAADTPRPASELPGDGSPAAQEGA